MIDIPNTSANIELLEATVAKINADEAKAKAEKKVVSAIATRHRLIGVGALLLGLGAGAGTAAGGYALYLDKMSDFRKPTETLVEALAQGLSTTVINTTATGTVALETADAKPIRVTTEGAALPVNTAGATLRIESSDIGRVIDIVQQYLDRRSESPAASVARTSMAVVKTVPVRNGEVQTRWEYSKENPQMLIQRCVLKLTTGDVERLYEVARDQQPRARHKDLTEIQFQDAVRSCVWSTGT
jgi:hypothetical protein